MPGGEACIRCATLWLHSREHPHVGPKLAAIANCRPLARACSGPATAGCSCQMPTHAPHPAHAFSGQLPWSLPADAPVGRSAGGIRSLQVSCVHVAGSVSCCAPGVPGRRVHQMSMRGRHPRSLAQPALTSTAAHSRAALRRVVTVSSVTHRWGNLCSTPDRLRDEFLRGDFGHRYWNTKLANCMVGYELQRRLGARGVQVGRRRRHLQLAAQLRALGPMRAFPCQEQGRAHLVSVMSLTCKPYSQLARQAAAAASIPCCRLVLLGPTPPLFTKTCVAELCGGPRVGQDRRVAALALVGAARRGVDVCAPRR